MLWLHWLFKKSEHPDALLYADTLEQAALNAWTWLQTNPGYSYYNNAGFNSANPEISEYQQLSAQVGAAVLLFALTGDTQFRNYVDEHYDEMHPLQWWFWYPWESIIQDLLLFYSVLPNGTTAVKNAIRNSFTNAMNNNGHLKPAIDNTSCGYRAYMNNGDNVWGSNRPRGHTGSMIYNMITYALSADTTFYTDAAAGYAHFLHGVNPISTVMLTNMYDYGAEKSANEMYHGWFADGTAYDNALTSPYGPAPGYQPGGFNPHYVPDPAYGGSIVPPQFQPSLKSYKDWNTSWPENSWEITETSISNQGSYVKLLSHLVHTPCVTTITNPYDAGYGTLRQAIGCAASGDTIRIQLQPGDSLHLQDEECIITKNLVILNANPGQVTWSFDVPGNGLYISANASVHLKQIEFTGTANTFIRNAGDLHLSGIKMNPTGITETALHNQGEAVISGQVEIRQ